MDVITILDSEEENVVESPLKKIKTAHEGVDLDFIENKENQSEESTQTNNIKEERIPHYYLNNFFLVLNSVLTHHGHLLSEDESAVVKTFRELDEPQQRLYIRLWQRKGPWFRFHQITYREILNVQDQALVLESQGLAQVVLKPTPDNLPFLLDLLNLTELKQLITDAKISATAKALNRKTSSGSTPKLTKTPSTPKVNSGSKSKSKSKSPATPTPAKSPSLTNFFKPSTPNNGNNKISLTDSGSSSQDSVFEIYKDPSTDKNDESEPTKKQQLIQSILSQKGQRTLDGIPSVSRLVWKTFFKEQGCVQLAEHSVKLFNRITHLFFLNEYTQQNLLLLADMKKICYPPYICRKESKLFATREDFLLYEKALKLEQVFWEYCQAQLFEKSRPIANSAAKWILGTCDSSRDPVFLPSSFAEDKPDSNNNNNSQNGLVDLTDDSQSQSQSSELQGSLNEEATFGTLSTDFEQKINGGFFTEEVELKECFDATKTPKEVDELIEQKLFLARFTHGWVLARIMTEAYKILEKQRLYDSAVLFLRILLSSKFLPSKRGKWWVRLSLNLEHLGRKTASLETAECALKDPYVKAGCRLTLQRRVLKLSKPPRRWKVPIFTNMTLKEATVRHLENFFSLLKEITINGVLLRSVTGLKSKFMSENGSGACNVEIFALEHYQTTYGWKGFHSENGIFTFLFGVYMWDILFADVIDVFQTPFQNAPLDLNTEAFYPSRKEIIEAKLKEIETADDISALLMDSWGKHQGMQCLGVQWDKYDLVEMVEIVTCFGGKALSAIFKLLCEDYRHWTSGFPDLILWNMETKTSKLSEVKGPRDKLSDKQRAWIDQLLAAGVDVEICHVAECSEGKF